jgi:hypothetical protein
MDTTTATRRPSTRLDLRMPAVVVLCAAGYAVSIAAVVHLQAIRDPAFSNTVGSQPVPVSVAAAPPVSVAAAPPVQVVGSDTPTSTQVLANDITALEAQAQSVAAQARAVAGPGNLGDSQFSIGAPRTHGTTGGSGQN